MTCGKHLGRNVMAFLAFQYFAERRPQVSLVSADSSQACGRVASDTPRRRPGRDVVRSSREVTMTRVARFGRFLISLRIHVAARSHAADVASCRDPVVICAVACLASIHIPITRHDFSPVKCRRRRLSPTAGVRISVMACVATYAARASLEILSMAGLA